MKRTVIISLVILVPLALIFGIFSGTEQEFTSSSPEAYKLYEEAYADLLAFNNSAAEVKLKRALELDENFAIAHALMITVNFQHGRPDEAKREAAIADSLALLLTNDLERAKVQLATYDDQRANMEETDSLINYILAEQPNNLLALTARAHTLFNMRDPAAADAFKHILEIEPNHAPAYNILGYMAGQHGDYDQAEKYLRKYAFMAPELANPHDSLGEILTWAGKYEEAKAEFLTAVQIQPDFYVSLINLGNLYMLQGQLAKGREILDQVYEEVDIDFRRQAILEVMVRNYYLHNMFDKTMEIITKRNEMFPEDKFYLAVAGVIGGHEAEGMTIFADYIEEQYARPELSNAVFLEQVQILDHNFRSILARHTGDLDGAIEHLQKILELRADNPPHEWTQYRCRLAEIYYEAGRYKECATQAFLILENDSGRIQPILLLARSAHNLGKDDIARQAMGKLKPLMAVVDEEVPAKAIYRQLAKEMALPID